MAKEVEKKISCLGNEVYLNLFSTFVMAEKQRNVFLNNQLTVNTPLKYERKWNKLFWISGLSIKVKYSNALRLLMIFSFLLKNQKLVISGIIIFCQWRSRGLFWHTLPAQQVVLERPGQQVVLDRLFIQ